MIIKFRIEGGITVVTIDAVVTGYLDNNTYLVTNDETKETFIVDPSFYVEKN